MTSSSGRRTVPNFRMENPIKIEQSSDGGLGSMTSAASDVVAEDSQIRGSEQKGSDAQVKEDEPSKDKADPSDPGKGSSTSKTRKRTKTGCLSEYSWSKASDGSMANLSQRAVDVELSAVKNGPSAAIVSSPKGVVRVTHLESSSRIPWAPIDLLWESRMGTVFGSRTRPPAVDMSLLTLALPINPSYTLSRHVHLLLPLRMGQVDHPPRAPMEHTQIITASSGTPSTASLSKRATNLQRYSGIPPSTTASMDLE